MTAIACNATPLIYLAKTGRLTLLRDTYGQIIIPQEVKEETVDRGKEQGQRDAYQIENAIREGWIKVKQVEPAETPIRLHPGEAATLTLAKTTGVEEVLIDEASARTAAKLMGLTPRGTIHILLKALKMKLIDLDEFLKALSDLTEAGFRLREEVYLEAIRRAREIAEQR